MNRTDYVTWNGPDPDLRSGTARALAKGPNRDLRRGNSGVAKGPNASLRKGPSGSAKGSIYSQLHPSEQTSRGN